MQVVNRLRKEGKDCNFGADFDNQLRDAVLCKCRSNYVRRKLLEEKEELTLTHILELAGLCESVEHQMSQLSMSEPSKVDANRVYKKAGRPKSKQRSNENKGREIHCYRCGSTVHLGGDSKCPARGQTCRKFKGKDHFASVFKTKAKKPGVNQIQEEPQANGERVDYAFRVTDRVQ